MAVADLKGRVALVTGATRGVGRGIAEVLGEHGATVYVTGRTAPGNKGADGLPGTIDDAAEAVTRAGGKGIGLLCDHTDDAQVRVVFERIATDSARLDLLVNNVWGGYEGFEPSMAAGPFWELPIDAFDKMFATGVRAHMVASSMAIPLMVKARGLIITISSGDRGKYRGWPTYDVIKSATNRLAFAMSRVLHKHGITSLAVQPGWTRTERIMQAYDGNPPPETESPHYTGRAVAALATDPDVKRHNGKVYRTGDVAEMYGFTDVDGRKVPPFDLGPDYPAPETPL